MIFNKYDLDTYGLNTSFEQDEDFNERFLEQSFDKNDVNIYFFENQNGSNSFDYDNEINLNEFYIIKKEGGKKVKESKVTLTGNTGNTSNTRNNILSITKVKPTEELNHLKITKIPKNLEKIFLINKINKKLGRIEKSKKNIKGKHNKWSQDNIIQKIKASFHERIFNYINKEYDKYLIINNIKRPQLIKRITPVKVKKIKKDDNLLWFSLKLKDLFSMELSSKYTRFGKNYNKNNIEKLYRENEAKNVINILEKTVREMFNDFCNDTPIDGFETLKYDLEYQKKKMEEENEDNIEEYLKKYKDIAQNLELIFKLKKSRINRKKYN